MAVTKRIFQLSKEFERDEKEIIAFLTAQGIKVSNRLSAVNEDAYLMLKAKFLAPPPESEPEIKPESKPEPKPAVKPEVKPEAKVEPPAPKPENTQPAAKKKKKNKDPQVPPQQKEPDEDLVSDEKIASMDRRTQSILFEGINAGNEFIRNYTTHSGQELLLGKKKKDYVPHLTPTLDTWNLLFNHKFEYSDASPARYWNSVAKLMTRAFKINNAFGLSHREDLAKIREATKPLGIPYQPREIFSDAENQKFAAQQKLLFELFGHGMGLVNDNLFDLKLKAERMKIRYEHMNFLEYATNPADELRSSERVPFDELAEAVTYALRGVARRVYFFQQNEARIGRIISDFFEWIDGYAKLKSDGADVFTLKKYLELEEKFVDLCEFMSFDNLILYKKKKPSPFDTLVDLLKEYRDNLADPDAERNFKYKVRGVINVIFKPKEFVFIYRFAELEPYVDYRTPEMIAAEEAAKAAKAAEAAAAEEKENPADTTDEA